MSSRRHIVHVDMDAFFAAIEQRDNPSYRSKPVVVGSDPKGGKGRGVVSTCSYEARKFGIHSAMPISAAYRRCPHAIFLPVDMDKYYETSRLILDIFNTFTPEVEPVGIDEAFLDITGSCHLFGTPAETCLKIKSKIKRQTGLTASAGLAPTKMAAKIASDLEKPDGMVVVTVEGLLDFLWPLDVRRIWGIGKKCADALSEIGIRTIGELANRDPEDLTAMFGKNGLHYWELANGIDDRSVEPETEAKSISNEITFGEDLSDDKAIHGALMSLCENVSERMRQDHVKCRTITLKIRLEDFRTHTRSITVPESTNFADILYKDIKALYNNFETSRKRVRLVGVKASNISCGQDGTLFSGHEDKKRKNVHEAIDDINRRFGKTSIRRATGMP